MHYGKKVWIFPDAELPPVGENVIPGHESVIITNTGDSVANVKITLLYTARFDEQYAIMLESDVPVVAQYGRAEPRQVAFYTTPGYCE